MNDRLEIMLTILRQIVLPQYFVNFFRLRRQDLQDCMQLKVRLVVI